MEYEYEKLTITAQAYNQKVSVEYPQDLDIMQLMELFKTITVGLSFSENNWKDAVLTLAEEYKE